MSTKKDARTNAAERIAARDHLSEQPSIPMSDKAISQGRFPGETPLTGEDRPLDEAGHKQHGHDDTAAVRASTGPMTDRTDHGGANAEFGTEVGE